MVVFTCNNCGESVKKPSVEKHYNGKCRNSPKNVSCMDCQKDFHGEEYVTHTKCISEVEKYSGKNYVPKEKKNSGEKKQATWTDIVRSILESTQYELAGQTLNIFQRLQNYENVPRKKTKFENFVANSLRVPAKQAKPVWKILEKEMDNLKKAKQQEKAANLAAGEQPKKAKDGKTSQKNGLKHKLEDEPQEENVEIKKAKTDEKSENKENGEAKAVENTASFQWSTVLEKIVAKHPEGLSLEKVQKKLLKKYKTNLNLEELNEKQQKKFGKKFSQALKKCPAVKVDGDVVKPSC